MSFTKSTTDISVHQKLGDYPNQDNGMTADELKKKFDYPAEILQNDLNKIVEELESESATQNIGASRLDENDETENNVQAKLNKVYTEFKQVRDGGLKDNSIETSKLKDNVITTEKIIDSAITTNKIENSAITTEKIADGNITNKKIADGSITGEKIDDNVKKAENITAEKINPNDVSNDNVQAKLNKIYEDMVGMTQGGVADNSITTEKLKSKCVTTEKISDSSVTLAKIDFELFLVPSGFIGMWSGSVIPNGWYLCDGNNGTPDLRNRFIVGSGGEYAISNTGGEKTHTLTVNEMPSHNHTLSYANKNYDLASGDCLASGELGTWKYSYDRYSVTTKSTGGGQAHENRPPYYALAFIMKA